MQRFVERDWLKQLRARAEPALARVAARRIALVLALALTGVFVVGGGLSQRLAIAGLLVSLLWASAWPHPEAGQAPGGVRGPVPGGDALWRMVVDAVPEPAVVLDGTGHVMHQNARAVDLFGARRSGMHAASMSRDPELLAAVDEALATGSEQYVELHERVPLERRLLATVASLTGERAGEGPALLVSFRDLSDQDRLTRMRADFVANASHELRTPLASLRGFVETLQGAAKDDAKARERFLKVMSEQAERMTRLIDDLLSLSRVEMREHLPPGENVDLNEAVAHVNQTLQPLAAKAHTTIEFRPLDAPAIVRGDRDELVQVFQNLVQNALKYGKAGGRIEIGIASDGGRYLVSVKDDGPGIAAQHLPRLTERFYRVSVAASREKGGTGLGLAIVKHILNRHRGELSIASRLGEGSTFSVTLPILKY